jgi:hypothetical protein
MTMWMKPDAYLRRLQNTLEQVVAPEIEDDAVRGQLYAVSDLLNQLGGKIEYNRDLIAVEVREAAKMLARVLAVMEGQGVSSPEELAKINAELSAGARPIELKLQAEAEEAVCRAIDHFHANRNKMLSGTVSALDKELRDYMLKAATREIALVKPPQMEKISRSKRPERKKR